MTIEQPVEPDAPEQRLAIDAAAAGGLTDDVVRAMPGQSTATVHTAALYSLTVSGLQVEVSRKPVKHLHIGVYPPDGAVRVTAPLAMPPAAIHVAVVTRLPWIRRQKASFEGQQRESPRELVSGESHWVFGQRLRLRVEATSGRTRITVLGKRTLVMQISPDASTAARQDALQRWYRAQLRAVLAPLVDTWSARLNVQPNGWRIQRMKTRWGSCSRQTSRLLFNLELARHSLACVEYIVVHELAHLLAPTHDARFHALLDHHLPHWRALRKELSQGMLAV